MTTLIFIIALLTTGFMTYKLFPKIIDTMFNGMSNLIEAKRKRDNNFGKRWLTI